MGGGMANASSSPGEAISEGLPAIPGVEDTRADHHRRGRGAGRAAHPPERHGHIPKEIMPGCETKTIPARRRSPRRGTSSTSASSHSSRSRFSLQARRRSSGTGRSVSSMPSSTPPDSPDGALPGRARGAAGRPSWWAAATSVAAVTQQGLAPDDPHQHRRRCLSSSSSAIRGDVYVVPRTFGLAVHGWLHFVRSADLISGPFVPPPAPTMPPGACCLHSANGS